MAEEIREAFHRALRSLAGDHGEFVLQLSPEAAVFLQDWESEIEAMLGEGGQMEIMRDWGAKLAGATLRLAAVMHCVEHGLVGSTGGRTFEAAVEIARYLIPHAAATFELMSDTEDDKLSDALYLLRSIERHELREFSKSEAQHHGKRRFPKANDIDSALKELLRRRFIRHKSLDVRGHGRPPSQAYEVNPAAFAKSKPETRSCYSRNMPFELENGNSGNIGSAQESFETLDHVRVTI